MSRKLKFDPVHVDKAIELMERVVSSEKTRDATPVCSNGVPLIFNMNHYDTGVDWGIFSCLGGHIALMLCPDEHGPAGDVAASFLLAEESDDHRRDILALRRVLFEPEMDTSYKLIDAQDAVDVLRFIRSHMDRDIFDEEIEQQWRLVMAGRSDE